MGHPLRFSWGKALVASFPLIAAFLVVARQARPFAVISDDRSYYAIASRTAAATRAAAHEGPVRALGAFFRESSVRGELPPHISRKRPLLLWVWSGAFLAFGNAGLVWTWRILSLLTILLLFVALAQRSRWPVASATAVVVAVAPAMQGLLAWMSCSTYVVGYPLLLGGIVILRAWATSAATVAGCAALVGAMLCREVIYLLVATAVATDLWCAGRRRLAAVLPALAVLTWLLLPGEDRSILGLIRKDPALALRSSLTVLAGQLGSLTRNTGALALGAAILLTSPWRRVGIVLALATVAIPVLSLVAPILLLLFCARTRDSLPGVVWATIAAFSLCLYGTFTSRYAMEPLLGLALAVAPAITPERPRWADVGVGALVLWQAVTSLAPDAVYRWGSLRFVGLGIDKRFEALELLTAVREREWASFAGRACEWEVMPEWSVLSREGVPEDRVRRGGPYLRLGWGCNLRCPQVDDVVVSRTRVWEWNVWYWRVVPPKKGGGVHVGGPDPWTVHVGDGGRGHRRCRFVVPVPAPKPRVDQEEALDQWIADAPEVMNPRRVRAWLEEVWRNEEGCPDDLRRTSFRELELGRLLVRDDGWLDLGELACLRRTRQRVGSPAGP